MSNVKHQNAKNLHCLLAMPLLTTITTATNTHICKYIQYISKCMPYSCIHTNIHTYIHTYIHTHTYIHAYMHAYKHTYSETLNPYSFHYMQYIHMEKIEACTLNFFKQSCTS